MNLIPANNPPLAPKYWPCEQSHVLLVIKQKEYAVEQERRQKSLSIRDVDFHSEDEVESGYEPSESEASDELEIVLDSEDGAEVVERDDPMDLDVDENEVKDLEREVEEQGWPSSSPTPSKKESIEVAKFHEELTILEAAEKEAAASYDPDEVVKLLTELYELLVEMTQWSQAVIHHAPHHNPPLNEELAKELGYDLDVIGLMRKLPYVEDRGWRETGELLFQDGRLCRYTDDRHLERGRKFPLYPDYQKEIESWILPLVQPRSRDGWLVFLDTRLGVIRAFMPMYDPPENSIEFRRHGPREEDDDMNTLRGPFMYQRAPLVPAARYLRTLIECYRSLDRIPMWEAYFTNECYPAWSGSADWKQTVEAEYGAVVALYGECGWPDVWDRAMFVEKWEVLKVELRERRKEKAAKEGKPWSRNHKFVPARS